MLRKTELGPISIDTRTLARGDTFWALKGERDGHDFVTDAFAKGAKAAVVNQSWLNVARAPAIREKLITVADTKFALTEAGRAWRAALNCPVIGITGTNGKTSTKDLILKLLSLRYAATGTQGNLNNEIGVPLTLLAVPGESQVLVVEMGASHVGEVADLCRISRPTHGLVTSIGKAHLAGFGDLEGVVKTKE